MPTELLAALVMFAFVSSITPGPNNLMLMASGANFGVRRTVPHMLGVAIGFVVMVVLVGIGLMGLFEAVPSLHTVLLGVSVAYLLWLAWRIATAVPRGLDAAQEGSRPLTFLQAAAFQWVNPKGWGMALTAIAAYAPERTLAAVVAVALVFGLVNLPSVGVWAVLGQGVRRVLSTPGRLRAFNVSMALLLVASIAFVIVPV